MDHLGLKVNLRGYLCEQEKTEVCVVLPKHDLYYQITREASEMQIPGLLPLGISLLPDH